MSRRVCRLIGVYHADGGVRGELTYVLGSMLGRTHCSLCDITHSHLRRRKAWDEMADQLGVPFELVHLNERDHALETFTGPRTPTVVAEVDEDGERSLVELVDAATLNSLGGEVSAFHAALAEALAREDLSLTA